MKDYYDVVIIGAGAAGMMCAVEAGNRSRTVLLIDHSPKIGKKIRISGGGRCNFTNMNTLPEHFLSSNPHFSKSALSQYTPYDFVQLIEKHGIKFHEKAAGQLFCDDSAQQVIDMLVHECEEAEVEFSLANQVNKIESPKENYYELTTDLGHVACNSLVIATGGLSIPKLGATRFGYELATKFNLNVVSPKPGLVPFVIKDKKLQSLRGISLPAQISANNSMFEDSLLFTHKGLSGPSVLQISSYWYKGDEVIINCYPDSDLYKLLKTKRNEGSTRQIKNLLQELFPQRFVDYMIPLSIGNMRTSEISDNNLQKISDLIQKWIIYPVGTEGYPKAEVTVGGIDTNELSSRTMECRKQEGLFFIGEVLDVTGHLGGFNFQWAWSSGFAAGQVV
ncbi:MAG: NAD(P)/FAD-dependent oxidoreductase [Dehalococcoidia bacterium]|tara:strand:+ start:153 stop:1328 length:1176 start_codon:yes stop_codon:yes gene_type:complete